MTSQSGAALRKSRTNRSSSLLSEGAPLFESGDWVAGGEREIERLAAYDAGRPQREPTGRHKWRNDPR